MRRKCAECPEWTQTVCRHAFGKFWNDKSTNGEGCDFPLDDVAEAWYAAGWKPWTGATISLTLPLKDAPKMPEMCGSGGGSTGPKVQLKMPTRPRCHTASKIQSGMPRRPKVSAAIRRQAELFFGRADR